MEESINKAMNFMKGTISSSIQFFVIVEFKLFNQGYSQNLNSKNLSLKFLVQHL